MKTSVVMATFNGSRYILEQLNSIIHQSVLPSEIVISDDGSTDSTIEIVKAFIHDNSDLPIRFKLIHNHSDFHGVLGNFQNAAMNASGDYVFFCDQDDIWFKNKIERITGIMDSCDEQVVIHNAQVIRESNDGSFLPVDRHLMGSFSFNSAGQCKIDGNSQVWPLFYYCLIQGMCMCVKRNYLFSIFPFSKGSNHDHWILFCAAADNTILAVSDDLAYYRIHTSNTCGIAEYKKKRSLIRKLSTFDRKGRDSIINQFTWYMDTASYLGGRPITNERVKFLISFFTRKRIEAIAQNRIRATVLLTKSFKEGAYSIDGKIVFLHDLAYVWTHTKETRLRLVRSLDENLRSHKSAAIIRSNTYEKHKKES